MWFDDVIIQNNVDNIMIFRDKRDLRVIKLKEQYFTINT